MATSSITEKNPYRVQGDTVWFFPTLLNFSECLAQHAPYTNKHDDATWAGESFDQSWKRCETGNTEMVATAQLLTTQLKAQLPDSEMSWETDVAGAYPCVPAFLTGEPDHMYRKNQVESLRAPVRIFYDPASSGGIPREHLTNRGTAVLALLLKLMETRPVELWLCFDGNESQFVCIKVATTPVDLASAAWMLTSPGLDRNLRMTFMSEYGYHGGWAREIRVHGNTEDMTDVRKRLRAAQTDIVIPPSFALNEPIYRNPVDWINQKIEECRFVA